MEENEFILRLPFLQLPRSALNCLIYMCGKMDRSNLYTEGLTAINRFLHMSQSGRSQCTNILLNARLIKRNAVNGRIFMVSPKYAVKSQDIDWLMARWKTFGES